jgi:hypothetical protein
VELTQIALLAGDLEPEPGADDGRCLDGSGQDAGQQHIGPHPAGVGEVVSQDFGLRTAMRRQPSAAGLPPDHAMEAGVCITVANQDQAHATTLGGVARWPVAWSCVA